jgi:hypothetical protein
MIRFRCPLCGKTLKAPEAKAGATIECPSCEQRSEIPLTGDGFDGSLPQSAAWRRDAPQPGGNEAPRLFPAMTGGGRWAVGLAAGAAVLSLLAAVAAPHLPGLAGAADTAGGAAMVLIPLCVAAVLVVLHGAATGCPSCRRWWARRIAEKGFVTREVFERDGSPFARSTYRTTCECNACRHRWSATSTDEYKEAVRDRPRPRMG